MIYLTHAKIAELVLSRIPKHAITYISRTEFIKGSKHPDFDLSYRSMKHTFEGSIGVVRDLFLDVTTHKMSRYARGFKMGIIAHFLADYMCSYHSNPFYNRKNLTIHVRYEQKLHEISKSVSTYDDMLFQATHIDDFIEEIANFIVQFKNNQELSMLDDLNQALSLVHHMVHLVMNQIVPEDIVSDQQDVSQRVAIFTDTYYPQINGVSNTIYHYMKYLEDTHIPYVLISPQYKERMIDKEMGYDIIGIKSMSFFLYKEARIAVPNSKRLFRILDDFKPTVIHAMTEFFIGYKGLKYGKINKLPVVSNYSTHFVSHLGYTKLRVFQKPLNRYLTWFHNQAQLTTCPSSNTQEYLKTMGIKQTSVFGRGIYMDQFSPKYRDHSWRKQFGEHPFIYLYVGRISSEKELPLALDAFSKMKALYDDIVFVVVGDGPKKSIYEKQYKDVIFAGYHTGDMLSKLYASSDIFVFPSPTETLGNVVLEAMASGLPVIVANQGGVLENVKHFQNGMIATNQDVESYYNHMVTYYMDRKHYEAIQKQALADMKQKQWPLIFKKQIQSYKLLSINE
jgi:glycosyltransferase involved in cell wall biosynthesis